MWNKDYWTQNYFQIANTSKEGEYLTMTCNTQYNQIDAPEIVIGNFYGNSFMVEEDENTAWNQMNNEDSIELEWFQKDTHPSAEVQRVKYTSNAQRGGIYWQTCVAIAKMYETGDDNLNSRYRKALKGNAVNIESGFRVWEEEDNSETIYAANAEPVKYKLHDFGLV